MHPCHILVVFFLPFVQYRNEFSQQTAYMHANVKKSPVVQKRYRADANIYKS